MTRKISLILRLLGWLLFIVSFVTPVGGVGQDSQQLGIHLLTQSAMGGLGLIAVGILAALFNSPAAGLAFLGLLFLLGGVLPNVSVIFWRLPVALCLLAIAIPWAWLLYSPGGIAIPGAQMTFGVERSASHCLCFYPWAIGITLIHLATIIKRAEVLSLKADQLPEIQNSSLGPNSKTEPLSNPPVL